MNSRILKTALGMAFGLFTMAVPGYSSVFLAFTGSTTRTGTITVNGNSSAETLINGITGVPFTTFSVSNDTLNSVANGNWALNATSVAISGNLLTFTGTIGNCTSSTTGGCTAGSAGALTGINLGTETINLAGYPYAYNASNPNASFSTNVGTQTSFNLTFGAATSLNNVATLLTDLGFNPSAVSMTFTGGYIDGTGTGLVSGGNYTFGSTSDSISYTLTATPEPITSFLFGSGLMVIGLVARKRSVQR